VHVHILFCSIRFVRWSDFFVGVSWKLQISVHLLVLLEVVEFGILSSLNL